MRIALGIEYDGANYFGWQRQKQIANTIQQQLETALSKVAAEPVNIFCAGRTDRGVHATNQVIHFDTQAERPLHAWMLGPNTILPKDLKVTWAQQVSEDFHARFSALERRYLYVILNRTASPAILQQGLSWQPQSLDHAKMQTAADFLIGEHDFSSFRAGECQAKSPIRDVKQIKISRWQDYIFIELRANAFLHHMVRNIVGALYEVGTNKKPPEWLHELLQLKDRKHAGVTAAANGLYLTQVLYPEEFNLPDQAILPLAFAAVIGETA